MESAVWLTISAAGLSKLKGVDRMAKIGVFVGSVYGNAQMVAEEAQKILQQQGHRVELFDEPMLTDWDAYQQASVLIITSTTGQGDLPDTIRPLFKALQNAGHHYPALHYGLIALGDRNYEHFCGAGHSFDDLLQRLEAQQVGELLEIDAAEVEEPEVYALPWIEAWGKLLAE